MESEIFWQAVIANDVRFDGAFVLGVKTTGIYCRPSCRARLPLRKNVDFYGSPAVAEGSGFRACKRCRPQLVESVDPQIEKIVEMCRHIAADDQISLEDLAATFELSASHLQRSFKEVIGVSPKKYAEVVRMERFKAELKTGSDVTSAMYDAGFGSSRALYEKADEHLGMTPSKYKKGGLGMNINYMIAECDLGKMLVARTSRGICSVTFGDHEAVMKGHLSAEFPQAEISEDAGELKDAVAAIVRHLGGKSRHLSLPLDLQATAFQLQVWQLLREIPYGETRSYSEIAESLGDKNKVRAVARACATNRVAVVIPCHRVIGKSGEMSGYRWGIERKEKLLAREKVSAAAKK